MKVDCFTLDEFLEDIHIHTGEHGPEGVLQKAVRVSITRTPFENCDLKKRVIFQASAVMVLPDGGEYLLQLGTACGIDYEDSSKEYAGTTRANEYRASIVVFCSNHGLVVRPGLIGI